MGFSNRFEVKISLYFRVHDSEIYGGPGSIGYAKQSFTLTPEANLDRFSDDVADGLKADNAKMLGVPPEKLDYITADEFERETEEDDEDEYD